ncbi:ArnT family glycosyltransferase [Nitrospirillum viridazoti]|uniref:4-amino-4-deoxy-L-arabinose transferase-like glycosyltransferase n=1 Tax=Nitrospirillum amazonense TaxID=28077 RepID=A0A560HK93_9PROT|nr:glycosyltransferase family 39 protein [Nitrospirillum amazonense]TWB46927.1 4-amino-4-deoxy-L-arabinose transferase-like glycosyltransferase [Nitrospirillum amazonense]
MNDTFRPAVLRPVHYVILALLALATFLPGFTTIPPFDRDESRFAQATRQMLETRDFVSIRFQDEARNKKPVGIHWLQSATVTAVQAVTGEHDPETTPIWAYRLPSLIGAVAAVLLTAWAGQLLFGATAGFGAALLMSVCVLLSVEARMAKTDAVLLATVVAAMGALGRIYLDRRKPMPPTWGLTLTFWIALGVGILIKGPVILLPVLGSIITLGFADRDWSWLKNLRPLPGLAIVLAMVLPWAILIAIATKGQFFADAIGHEFLGKVNSGQEKHAGPPGYYLITFWLSFWPGSLLVGLGAAWAWRRRHDDAVRFCLAWIVPTWLIFEAVATKLPHYVLPTFPALAFLGMAALLSRIDAKAAAEKAANRNIPREERVRLPLAGRIGRWAVIVLYLVLTGALAVLGAGAPLRLEGTNLPAGFVAGGLALATGIAFVVLERIGCLKRLTLGVAAGGALSMISILGLVMPSLKAMWLSPTIAQAVADHRLCPTTVLAATGYTEPSMVFLVGTKTKLGEPDMVANHLADDPGCALALVRDKEEPAFAAQLAARGLSPELIKHFRGFNYSRGNWANLALYRAGAPQNAPAATEPAPQPPAAEQPAAATPQP